MQPSAYARALVASANPDPTPEDEAVIAQAKAEAEQAGTSDYVNQTLAGMAATAASSPGAIRYAEGLSTDFQELIEQALRRARRVDATTHQFAETTAELPLSPDREPARRFARQSALLRRLAAFPVSSVPWRRRRRAICARAPPVRALP